MSAMFDIHAFSCLRVEPCLYDLQQAVYASPQNIGQAAAVPETAHQESNEQIQTMSPFGHSVAAQRNVYIVPKPCG